MGWPYKYVLTDSNVPALANEPGSILIVYLINGAWTINGWPSARSGTLNGGFRVILKKEHVVFEVRLRINSITKWIGEFDSNFHHPSCPS